MTRRGFSLVEMLAAVAILSILALMGVPFAQSSKDREMEMSLRDTLTRLRQAVAAYAWNEDGIDNDVDLAFGEDPVGDPDGDGMVDDDRDGLVDEDGPPNYPLTLQALVDTGYLSNVPRDPMSTNPALAPAATWLYVKVTRTFPAGGPQANGIADVRSGCFGRGLDGSSYQNW